MRLLRGENLDTLSRELGVTAACLSRWPEEFLAAGEVGLAGYVFAMPQGCQHIVFTAALGSEEEAALIGQVVQEKVASVNGLRPWGSSGLFRRVRRNGVEPQIGSILATALRIGYVP